MKNFLISFAIGYYVRAIQKHWLAQAVKKGLMKSLIKDLTKTEKPRVDGEPMKRYDQGIRGV